MPEQSSSGCDAADRNLLFGVLAVQNNFIDGEALIAAMRAWLLDKAKPLGHILLEQARLSDERHRLLEAIVHEHLRKHNDDVRESIRALAIPPAVETETKDSLKANSNELRTSQKMPMKEIIDRLTGHDGELDASLKCVSAGVHEVLPTTLPALSRPQWAAAETQYQILRPHAKGGLGEVFVALDQRMNREVALKEIQVKHAGHVESRSRFLLEAHVTGRLEHPGIVPVYGLGTYVDGRPFYAMRFIRGSSLQDAIRRFHQADTPDRDLGERQLELRQLLGRFVAVCNAMAYAHSRGVLHRDLKPGNIMLGPYGETLVVDWGLAKVLGRQEGNVQSSESIVRSPATADSAETVAGSFLGTAAYTSPEQAAGRLEELGPASDVYSLGATLYSLLTGKAPFASADVGEVLQKVQRGDFAPPRQVQPNVPPALDAICRQAMAVKPEDRYASPRLLADDLEHWLADEPVTAYREPWPARLGRWARRHKVLVGGAGAAAAVAATVVIAVVLVMAAQARELQAQLLRQDAEAQRSRAEENEAEAAWQRELAEQNRAEAEKQRGLPG